MNKIVFKITNKLADINLDRLKGNRRYIMYFTDSIPASISNVYNIIYSFFSMIY